MTLATILLGPLAGPECRRALARGWLVLVRSLAALVIMGTVLVVLWIWWIEQQFDPDSQPFQELRIGLAVVEGMAVTIALVMGPAVLAGSLAGERERGALGLLLTTRVSAREIVLGRLVGKLTQVAMILLAVVPGLVLLAELAGMSPAELSALLALPMAIGIGGGGIAVAASVLSRRGRDALLTVYMLDVLFLLSPLTRYTGLPVEVFDWARALNPFVCLKDIAWDDRIGTSIVTMGLWLALGLAGTALASWRLRPASLLPNAGERVLKRGRRRGWVPALDERPMLWKELFIEQAGSLGWAGRWLGALLVVLLGGGSLVLGGVVAWNLWVRFNMTWFDWAAAQMVIWIGSSGLFVGWLIEWAIGLRAAVTISSERERGTWDALLTSPLEGREIIWGKLWGSLYALRWLVASVLLAWTLATVCGAIESAQYVQWVANLFVVGTYMAAVGVRTSLASPTATRAMALTIGLWLGSMAVVSVLAAIVIGAAAMLCLFGWMAAAQLGLASWSGSPWFPLSMRTAWPVTTDAIYVLATLFIVGDTSLRFDRIAGRMTEGKVAVALEEILHGRPMEPVFMGAAGEAMPDQTPPQEGSAS